MALPLTNISISAAKAALSETNYSLTGLCGSIIINEWSWPKPADYGYWFDGATNYWNSIDAKNEVPTIPAQGVANGTSGYRLGDFRWYNHTAMPPLTFETGLGYNYGLMHYTDTNVDDGHLIPYLAPRGEMPACTNNDGFNPDFVNDQTAITLYPEIWQATTLKYTGAGTTINYETVSGFITLATMAPTGLTPGSYTLKVKQMNSALDQGHIQDETTFSVSNVLAYGLSGSSNLWWDSGTIFKPLVMSSYLIYDQATSPSTTTLLIEMEITYSATGVLFKSNGLTTISGTVSATVGSVANKSFDTLGVFDPGDTITCTVKNNATSYLYNTYYLTIT